MTPGDVTGRFAGPSVARFPSADRRRLALFAVALCAVGLALRCGGSRKPGRVIVLGLDGADPQTIDLLMSEGKLPNFARLRRGGAYAPLRSAEPLLSPVIWTTIATGKTPDQHGIAHFVAVNSQTGEQLPVTSSLRRVKALWNILSTAGRSTDVVGWWATWPAEKVRGAIVSDHLAYHFLLEEGVERAGSSGKTYPASLEQKILPLLRKPRDTTAAELAPFVAVTADELARPFDFRDDLSHFRWAYATAESYSRIGARLWKDERPDNLLSTSRRSTRRPTSSVTCSVRRGCRASSRNSRSSTDRRSNRCISMPIGSSAGFSS